MTAAVTESLEERMRRLGLGEPQPAEAQPKPGQESLDDRMKRLGLADATAPEAPTATPTEVSRTTTATAAVPGASVTATVTATGKPGAKPAPKPTAAEIGLPDSVTQLDLTRVGQIRKHLDQGVQLQMEELPKTVRQAFYERVNMVIGAAEAGKPMTPEQMVQGGTMPPEARLRALPYLFAAGRMAEPVKPIRDFRIFTFRGGEDEKRRGRLPPTIRPQDQQLVELNEQGKVIGPVPEKLPEGVEAALADGQERYAGKNAQFWIFPAAEWEDKLHRSVGVYTVDADGNPQEIGKYDRRGRPVDSAAQAADVAAGKAREAAEKRRWEDRGKIGWWETWYKRLMKEPLWAVPFLHYMPKVQQQAYLHQSINTLKTLSEDDRREIFVDLPAERARRDRKEPALMSDAEFKRRDQDAQRHYRALAIVRKHLDQQAEVHGRGKTFLGHTAEILSAMPAFFGEFMLLTPAAGAVKAGAARLGLRALGWKALTRTGRMAMFAMKYGAAGAVRTATHPMVVERTLERMLPKQFAVDDMGNIEIARGGQKPVTALLKGIGDTFVELVSEELGVELTRGAHLIGRGVLKRFPKAVPVLRKIEKALRIRWLGRAPGRTTAEWRRMMAAGGFHGVLEEMGEERVAEVLRVAFNLHESEATDVNKWLLDAIPSGRQLLAEGVAFGIWGGPGIAMRGAGAVGEGLAERRTRRGERRRKEGVRPEAVPTEMPAEVSRPAPELVEKRPEEAPLEPREGGIAEPVPTEAPPAEVAPKPEAKPEAKPPQEAPEAPGLTPGAKGTYDMGGGRSIPVTVIGKKTVDVRGVPTEVWEAIDDSTHRKTELWSPEKFTAAEPTPAETPAEIAVRYEAASERGLPSIEDLLAAPGVHYGTKAAARALLEADDPAAVAREFFRHVVEGADTDNPTVLKAAAELQARVKDPTDRVNDATEAASVIARVDFRKVRADRVQPTPAEKPAEAPGKEDLARRIAEASRRPPLEIVAVRELKGSDGKWYRAGGFPLGVTHTGETRIADYAYRSAEGTIIGKGHPTAEAAREAQKTRSDAQVEEFYQQLLGMSDAEVKSQADYWLKEGAEPKAAAEAKSVAELEQAQQRYDDTVGKLKAEGYQITRCRVKSERDEEKLYSEGYRPYLLDDQGELGTNILGVWARPPTEAAPAEPVRPPSDVIPEARKDGRRQIIRSRLRQGKPIPAKLLEEFRGEEWADKALADIEAAEPTEKPTELIEPWQMTREAYAGEGPTRETIPIWEVNVRYLDNPAGPLRGKVQISSTEPPAYNAAGIGPFGRYRITTKRPRKVGQKEQSLGVEAAEAYAARLRDHEILVRRAVEEGKEVAPAVLKDYRGQHWADAALAKPAEAEAPAPIDTAPHYVREDDGRVYVDTNFLNAVEKAIPDSKVAHLGMGDFELTMPGGSVKFIRADEHPIPGKVGRAHHVVGDAALIEQMLEVVTPAARPAEAPAEVSPKPTEPAKAKKPSITQNLSAEDQAELERLKKQLGGILRNRTPMGLDAEGMVIATRIAGLYIKAGIKSFVKFVQQLAAEMPDIAAKLTADDYKSIFSAARYQVPLDMRTALTTPQAVDGFANEDLEAIARQAMGVAPAEAPAPAATEANPQIKLARRVIERLVAGDVIDQATFFSMADEVWGGTRAEGTYGPSEAYDGLELGINQYLQRKTDPRVAAEQAKIEADSLEGQLDRIPAQRNRSGEKDLLQQFSTPPHYAYAVTWLANIGPNDVVLEPSAGTGSIAIHAQNAGGAQVYANEISGQRAGLLGQLGLDAVFTEDAEQIHNILPARLAEQGLPRPTVILMNPPFSRAGQRMGDKRMIGTDLKHVEAALNLLQDGGRVVAIVGAPMRGQDTRTFTRWAKRIGKEYSIRAVVAVERGIYRKYGTAFPTRVLVIDKTGPTTAAVVSARVDNLAEFIDNMSGVRNERTGPTEQQSPEPAVPGIAPEARPGARPGLPAQRPARPVAPGAGAVGRPLGAVPGVAPRPGGRPGGRRAGGRPTAPPAGPEGRPGGRGAAARPTEGEAGRPGARPGVVGEPVRELPEGVPAPAPGIAIEAGERARERKAELTQEIFEPYRPARLKIPGAQPHPGSIVESAAMATVMPPVPTYRPDLPQDIIKSGALSEIQVEAAVYAGQAHEKFLPAPEGERPVRRGFMFGDGTGVGKTREICAVILDNWRRGRRKVVWITQNKRLLDRIREEWVALGQDPKLIFEAKSYAPLRAKRGILFMTYSTLRGTEKKAPKGQQPRKRVDQVFDWVGEDFDGVLVFDEAHNMGNAIAIRTTFGTRAPSQQARVGVELQNRLPNCRMVYATATAATNVANYAYADRLGLWGRGTPFPNKAAFINEIARSGVAAMETVARDMKAMGSYMARNISYNDGTEKGTVEYKRVEHTLRPNQREAYDTFARAWRIVLNNIEEALQLTGGDGNARAKMRARGAFWGANLRFFNQILMSMQMPTVVKAAEKDLAEGRSVVLQLVNTNEAATARALAGMQSEQDLDDIDITPRDSLMQLVEHTFPVQQYQEETDDQGNVTMEPVVDSDGNPVLNQEAVRMRDQLLDKLGALSVPRGPLDYILDHFAVENVAEVTGRRQRVVEVLQEDGTRKRERLSRNADRENPAEIAAFMGGKKFLLVMSGAGNTGDSYHASLAHENQQRRSHYIIQPGYRAEQAFQGMGRTHRSNQASAPIYTLCTTDLSAERRFTSVIAQRLDQLGALTKGQREATSGGLFSAEDNLHTTEAREALSQFWRELYRDDVEGLSIGEVQEALALRLIDGQGNLRQTLPVMRQFLNRLLSCPTDTQNQIFEAFDQRRLERIDAAIRLGTIDRGIETVRADRIDKVEDRVVYTHAETGAETKYVKVKLSTRIVPVTWDNLQAGEHRAGHPILFYVQSKRAGKVYAIVQGPTHTETRTGRVVRQYRQIDQKGHDFIDMERIDNDYNEQYWRRLDEDEARRLWDEQVEKLPEFRESEQHLITGVLLPIWDRIRGARPRVRRMLTNEGEELLGRIINANDVAGILRALGADKPKMDLTPQQMIDKTLDGETILVLSNGWTIRSKLVGGETRLEVLGPDLSFHIELDADGVFRERVGYKVRYFIPTGDEALQVFQRVTESRPVTDVRYLNRSGEVDHGPVAAPPVPVSMEPADRPVSINDIRTVLSEGFGVPLRTGHYRGPYAGIYKRFEEVARTKGYGDVASQCHEVAHHLDKRERISRRLSKDVRAEVRELDYDPEKKRTKEGVAEFVRLYLTTENAQDAAPLMYEWFTEDFLPTSEYAEAIADAKATITQWRAQGAVARVGAQIDKKSTRWKTVRAVFADPKEAWQKGLEKFVNRFQPLWRAMYAMADTTELADIPAEYRFAQMAKVTSMAGPARARRAVLDYMPDVMGNRVGPSLAEVWEPIMEDLRDPQTQLEFEIFLYSRHAIDIHAVGKNPGISLADARFNVRQFGDRPGWVEAADGTTKWHDQLLDYGMDAGGLDPAGKVKMRRMYPHYVPRMISLEAENLRQGKGVGGGRLAGLPSVVRRMKGSGRPIISPLESSMMYADRIFSLADKIRVGKMLVEATEHYEGMGKYVEKVAPGGRVTSAQIRQLQAQLEAADVALEDADLDAVINIFQNVYHHKAKDNIIVLWQHGKLRMYEVAPDMYRAMMAVDQQFELPKIVEWTFGKAARMLRLSTTGLRAGFAWYTNPTRDTGTAIMQTRTKGRKATLPSLIYRNICGVMDHVFGREVARLHKAGGGEMAQPLAIDRVFTQDLLDEVLANSPTRKVLNWMKHPIESLRQLFSITEMGPRLAEFKAALEETGWKPGDTITLAQYLDAQMRAANVTVDFREGGSVAMWLNRVVPFHNAQIQGPNRMIQTYRQHPVRSTLRGLAWITGPTLFLWWLIKDEDWYIDLPVWEKYRYWHVPVGDAIIRVPRPFEWGMLFGSLPEAACESLYRNDPKHFKEGAAESIRSFMPPIAPTAIKGPIEVAFGPGGWDWFRQRPIVSEALRRLEPQDQFYQYTTETAKALGRLLNVSPAKIEHLLRSYTGGMPVAGIRSAETVLRKAGVLPEKGARPPGLQDIPAIGRAFLRPGTTRVFNDFYREMEDLDRQHGSAKQRGRDFPHAQRAKRSAMHRISRHLAELRKQGRALIDSEASDEAKREGYRAIQQRMVKMAKAAMNGELAFMATPAESADEVRLAYTELLEGKVEAALTGTAWDTDQERKNKRTIAGWARKLKVPVARVYPKARGSVRSKYTRLCKEALERDDTAAAEAFAKARAVLGG